MRNKLVRVAATAALSLLAMSGFAVPTADAATDPFFTPPGSTRLDDLAPGTVLKSRTVAYHVAGIPKPLKVVQILYRTTDARGGAIVNATSVVLPPLSATPAKVVSYQSAYDSLNPADNPSRVIAGDQRLLGGVISNAETLIVKPLLLQGYTVVIPDTEGPDAAFAAGPVYGTTTLDSIRAAGAAAGTGVSDATKVGLLGYSGGAIGSNWAAALAPSYAPEVDRRFVGVAEGGLLVQPSRNLSYVSGSQTWASVMPGAVIGAARAYGVDFDRYLNDRGRTLFATVKDQSLVEFLSAHPGLKWSDVVKPQYADPTSVPEYVDLVDRINLGLQPSPTAPMLIEQGAAGYLDGTPGDKPGIGAGDGVMVAGDVRSLARRYCSDGTRVQYKQQDFLDHGGALVPWLLDALPWLGDRFAGKVAPSNCGSIPAGNPLGRVVVTATKGSPRSSTS